MKKVIFLVVVVLFFSVGVVRASDYSPMTGSAELNVMLDDINVHAEGDTEDFITSLSASYGVKSGDVRHQLKAGMFAGDIYMAARIASVTDHSFGYVTKIFKSNKTHGWGLVAKSLGINSGSNEFHALKDSSKMKKHRKMKGMKH